MPIDYGILHAPSAGSSVQMIQKPSDDASIIAGANSLNSAVNQAQDQRRANALLPGQLQAQSDAHSTSVLDQKGKAISNEGQGILNQGYSLDNKSKEDTLAAQQYAVKTRQDASAAYTQGRNQGGTLGGLNAMADSYLKNGDVETGLKLATTTQKFQQDAADNNGKNTITTANAMHQIMTDVKPPIPATTDPQTGKVNPGHPGITALDIYTARYPTLKKTNPDLPDPKSFRNTQQFEDTYIAPALAIASPLVNQQAATAAIVKDDKVYQAQTVSQLAQQRLSDSIRTNGADSPQTQEAAKELIQAQNAASLAATGTNYITGTLKAGARLLHLPESMGGDPSPDEVIKQNNPAQTQPAASQTAPQQTLGALQTGAKAVVNSALPPGVTTDMIQQELAKRQSQQGQ